MAGFGANHETLRLAGAVVQIAALEQVPLAWNMVLSMAFQGAGDTRTPMYVTLFGARHRRELRGGGFGRGRGDTPLSS